MEMPARISRAILFDLVGVLLFPVENFPADDRLDWFDAEIGQCTDDAKLRSDTMRRFQLTAVEFEQLLLRIAHKYQPYPPLWELLPSLRRHYRLGILNNGTYLTFPAFNARYSLLDYFDMIISSGMEGVCKPDAPIYKLAMERLGLPAEACLFMDDSMDNVSSASDAGMITIHWPDRETGFSRFKDWLQSEAG